MSPSLIPDRYSGLDAFCSLSRSEYPAVFLLQIRIVDVAQSFPIIVDGEDLVVVKLHDQAIGRDPGQSILPLVRFAAVLHHRFDQQQKFGVVRFRERE